MKNRILYETGNFRILQPGQPHIPREDGGHLYIVSKEHYTDRTEFPPAVAVEMIRLSQMAGTAYVQAMKEGGVNVARINYQENGNWAFRNGGDYKPFFHLHLYGRTPDSATQTWGEALVFPDPDTGFYEGLAPLTEEDTERFIRHMKELEQEPRFAAENWKL